jgi:hypothetical protein
MTTTNTTVQDSLDPNGKVEIAYAVFGRDDRLTWKRKTVVRKNLAKALEKLDAVEYRFRDAE